MKLSIDKSDLVKYTSCQLNHIFPDRQTIDLNEYSKEIDIALDRINLCYTKVSLKHYFDGQHSKLNHLHADQYLMYIWYLSNTIYRESQNIELSNKLYYLNKTLHGFDCMYNTELPDIFLIFHGVGTMLGKAKYSNYFIALQGVTIGSQRGIYPELMEGVSLAAHSSIIGNCRIGKRVSIAANSHIFEKDIPETSVVFIDPLTGRLNVKPSKNVYAQQFFNVDLFEK